MGECGNVELPSLGGGLDWDASGLHTTGAIRFVFHLVGGDRAVAEDLNQETWLEALDGIDRCDATRGSFRNWLFGIARRRVALYYRQRALAGNATSFSGQFEESAELGEISVLPKDVLEQVQQGAVVRAAVLGSSPRTIRNTLAAA